MIRVKKGVFCIAATWVAVAASASVAPIEVGTSPHGWLNIPGGEISLSIFLPGWSTPFIKADWAGAKLAGIVPDWFQSGRADETPAVPEQTNLPYGLTL